MDWGSLIGGGVSQLVMAERQRDVSARAAADARQSEEREAEKARGFSHEEAKISRDWSQEMANTAHQREVRDLTLAGLNPILSGTGGMGSATPGAAMASTAKASAAQAATPDYGRVISTALESKRNKAEVDNMETDTRKKFAEGTLASQLYNESQARTTNTQTEGRILEETLKGKRLEGAIDETKFGEIMRYIDRLQNSISPLRLGPLRSQPPLPPREHIHRRAP